MNLFSTHKIAEILDMNIQVVYYRISMLKIQPITVDSGIKLYSWDDLLKISCYLKESIMFYPLKTTETFCIYESKINKI